jgi:hypothetical protein
MVNFENILKSVDYFGLSFKLNFNNETKYKTNFGGFLTVIISILSISLLVTISLDLINRNQPKITTVEKCQQVAPYLGLSNENVLYSIGFIDKNLKTFYDPSYFYFSAVQVIVLRDNVGNVTIRKEIPLNLTNCSQYKDFYIKNGYEDVFNKNNFSQYQCLKSPAGIDIGGEFSTNYFSNIRFLTSKCLNKSSCKTLNEIDNILNRGYVEFYYINNNIQIENSSFPFQQFLANYYTSIDPGLSKRAELFFKKVTISSDFGIIFRSFTEVIDIVTDYFREWFFLENTNPNNTDIMTIYISSSKNILSIERYYMKIQDLSAVIGGFLNICIIIARVLTRYFNKVFMDEILLNKVFNFNNKEKDENQEFPNSIIRENDVKKIKKVKLKLKSKEKSILSSVKREIKNSEIYINSAERKNDSHFKNEERNHGNILPKNNVDLQKFIFYNPEENSKIHIGYLDVILLVIYCDRCSNLNHFKKQKFIQYARGGLNKYLDYLEIIKFLQEFKKLKFVLMNSDQITVFENLTKPIINQLEIKYDCQNNYLSSHNKESYNYDKFFSSYSSLLKNKDDKINQNLIGFIDPKFKNYLENNL